MAAPRNANRSRSADATAPPPRRSRSLAKLTRPRIHGAIPRERLFRLLDEARSLPVTWVAAPPGSGKTVLAATWLASRRRPGIWYQLDAGDGDPATFFYYLRQAADAAGARRKAPLPLLTPEYRGDVPGFARRWFRELFTRLAYGAVLALDNYQELPPGSLLHGALAAGCEEIPEGAQILVMSWADPPAELARLGAHQRVARIGSEALRLTKPEAVTIAAEDESLTAADVAELHTRSGGWAAGFTLLRERTRRTGLVNSVDQRATMQEVFDYFMALVFRDLPVDGRDALVEAAVLPRFTEAMAVELTGDPRVAGLLELLYRRHLFVERRYGPEVTYQYHVLFRAFLLDQARRDHDSSAMTGLLRRAAGILQRNGALEDALELLLQGGDVTDAVALVEKLAPGLVAAGRGAVLRAWIERLPESRRDARPALWYWHGAARMGETLAGARTSFEQAYAGYVRDGDRTGQAMAVAGVLQTFLLELGDLSPVERWLALVEPLLAADPGFPSDGVAVRVYGTLVGTMFWMDPGHPMLPVCVRRLEALLDAPVDDDGKLMAAGLLVEYYADAGWVRDAERVISAIGPLAGSTSASPLARAYWLFNSCRRDWVVGELDEVRAKLERARDIAEENQLRGALVFIHGILTDLELDLGRLEAVPPLLERLRALASGVHGPNAVARMHWIRGKHASLTGDFTEAVTQLEQACSTGSRKLVLAQFAFQGSLIGTLVAAGELARARQILDERRRYPRDRFPYLATDDAFDAIIADASGVTADLSRVRDWIRLLRQLGVEVPWMGITLPARQLAELLVRNGIELPYVTAWIRRLNMPPSSPDVPNWPWAVRIHTLGVFRVEVDGVPLRFTGKTPRKPLELLQALVAFGGRDVRTERLCDALWPDADGDGATVALRVTLSRLRKLLKRDVVIHRDGKIGLDERSCWVDLWSFRRSCAEIEAGKRDGAAARLLDLYRGAFLEHEREESWMLPARDDARRRFAAAKTLLHPPT